MAVMVFCWSVNFSSERVLLVDSAILEDVRICNALLKSAASLLNISAVLIHHG